MALAPYKHIWFATLAIKAIFLVMNPPKKSTAFSIFKCFYRHLISRVKNNFGAENTAVHI